MSVTTESPPVAWVPTDRTFGARLAMIRHEMKWNIKKAADSCGFPQASWRLWELNGGNPRDRNDIAAKVHERTGVDYLWLVHGRDRGGASTGLMPTDRYRLPVDPLAPRVLATIGAATTPRGPAPRAFAMPTAPTRPAPSRPGTPATTRPGTRVTRPAALAKPLTPAAR